jgi:hypothetical protein
VANEEERWNNAIEQDLGDGVVLQMVSLESPTGTVFARLLLCHDSLSCAPDVCRVIHAILQERAEASAALQQETTDELIRRIQESDQRLGNGFKSLNCPIVTRFQYSRKQFRL